MAKSRSVQYCNFCGKPHTEAGPFMEGDPSGDHPPLSKAYICIECAGLCHDCLEREQDKRRATPASRLGKIPSPRELYEYLAEYVIGQESAKRSLSVQVSNHYRRLFDNEEQGKSNPYIDDPVLRDVMIEKANVIILGPTGCGKTLLARSLATKLDVPFAIGDATTLTEAGYVGEDVENLLLKLLHNADFDVERAQQGIIYIDEIDKVGKTSGNVSITRDVSGEGVQQSLLKMIEGTIANVPPQGGRKHPEQQYIKIDTTDILFIVGGAFVGLEDIVGKRLNRKQMGFGANHAVQEKDAERNELLQMATHDDLIEYGIIPELAGRLPVLAALQELSVDDLVEVLTEPKNALLLQQRKQMAYHKIGLEFSEGAIREIAETAKKSGTGARALRSVVEGFMEDVFFDPPSNARGKDFVITEEVVRGEKGLFDDLKSEAA